MRSKHRPFEVEAYTHDTWFIVFKVGELDALKEVNINNSLVTLLIRLSDNESVEQTGMDIEFNFVDNKRQKFHAFCFVTLGSIAGYHCQSATHAPLEKMQEVWQEYGRRYQTEYFHTHSN